MAGLQQKFCGLREKFIGVGKLSALKTFMDAPLKLGGQNDVHDVLLHN